MTTAFVLDSSIAIAWFMPDEKNATTAALLDRATDEGAIVPVLWRFKVGNILMLSARKKRITFTQRNQALRILESLPLTEDRLTSDHAWNRTIHLADLNKLTLYDAAYLELAMRRELPLATLDEDLRRAAKTENVEVLGK